MKTAANGRPAGFWPIAIFFIFGGIMAAFAAITLLWPGTALDRGWLLNPAGHAGLSSLGRWIGIPFLALSAALFVAGFGWIKRRRWGWTLGAGVIVVNLAGDLLHLASGDWKSAFGVLVAGPLLYCMTRKQVRGYFAA